MLPKIFRNPYPLDGVRHVTLDGMRLHLRRNKDDNILWVNGINMLFLNETAADFIEVFIDKVWKHKNTSLETIETFVIQDIEKLYPGTTTQQLQTDFRALYDSVTAIAKGACPITDMNMDTQEVDPSLWKAPARMDLAITSKCNNNCEFCYMGGPAAKKELSTKQWKHVLDKLWNTGIPNVTFTGGEPTMRKDLPKLIDHAENFVTGIITNGRKLPYLADKLVNASLDYAQVSIESADSAIHDKMVCATGAWAETTEGIKTALDCGLDVVTNTTLTTENYQDFPELIKFGHSLGLKSMACNALICSGRGIGAKTKEGLTETQLTDVLQIAKETAHDTGISLQWYSPTCYNRLNPIDLGLGIKACSAAQYNMTIEPDGRVIPCQSWIHEGVGNILTDPWEKIWNHPTCISLRKHEFAGPECTGCEHLPYCGGGCPLERRETLNLR